MPNRACGGYCARLVIEVNGGQHSEERDAEHSRRLAGEGYRVFRFWNHDVLGNGDGVAAAIAEARR